jgi:HD-GYP domain-containing protein (c-di-GMP phosphodiesterase class II)
VGHVEAELATAHDTIRRLQDDAREAEQAMQQTQAQLLLYAADLHKMYARERGRMAELERAVLDLLMSLVHIVEERDPYTGSHAARVRRYGLAMARVLGWDTARQATLELGAQLHDVGKIGIADQILHKPGLLTPAEYAVMQTHVTIGLRILGGIRLLSSIMPYVAYHHERWDGSGYPFGLAGPAIPAEGRLLAVADAFDAITSERPYRAARPVAEGLRELQAHKGTQFDAAMVAALQQAYETGLLDEAPAPSAALIHQILIKDDGAVYQPWLAAERPAYSAPAPVGNRPLAVCTLADRAGEAGL